MSNVSSTAATLPILPRFYYSSSERIGTTLEEYQGDVARTISPESTLTHTILMLAAEAGECASLLQKEYQGHELNRKKLAEELGDVLWAIAACCAHLSIKLEDVADANIAKLKERYPDGFSAERSVNRAEH